MLTSAFTCKGAYAVLIMTGIKTVENRSVMPMPKMGRCAVGCSKDFCESEYVRMVTWAAEGWNVIVIWECGLKGREREKTLKKVGGWLTEMLKSRE